MSLIGKEVVDFKGSLVAPTNFFPLADWEEH